MSVRLPVYRPEGNRCSPVRLREPESWKPFAAALHSLSMGCSKVIAAACGVGPSRWSAMCNAQEPDYAVQLCRAMDAALAEGQAQEDVFAPLRLIAGRYGYDLAPQKAAKGGDLTTCSASLAREAGECLAAAIELAKKEDATPEQLATLEKEAQDVIEICHRLVREAQAKAGNVRPIRSA